MNPSRQFTKVSALEQWVYRQADIVMCTVLNNFQLTGNVCPVSQNDLYTIPRAGSLGGGGSTENH